MRCWRRDECWKRVERYAKEQMARNSKPWDVILVALQFKLHRRVISIIVWQRVFFCLCVGRFVDNITQYYAIGWNMKHQILTKHYKFIQHSFSLLQRKTSLITLKKRKRCSSVAVTQTQTSVSEESFIMKRIRQLSIPTAWVCDFIGNNS